MDFLTRKKNTLNNTYLLTFVKPQPYKAITDAGTENRGGCF